jgi:hypothetical protein
MLVQSFPTSALSGHGTICSKIYLLLTEAQAILTLAKTNQYMFESVMLS